MFGILTKCRHILYGIKRDGIYYYVKRPYGTLYHLDKYEILEAIYEEHQYDSLDVIGRQVIDIGADTGDTALQFAYRGAKVIYAYEPNVNSMKAFDLTINKNPYRNIKPFHKAITGKEGYIYINKDAKADRGVGLTEGTFKLETTTLDNIVKEYAINNGVLKMDCEGSEYEIIDNASDKTLLAFSQMAIELHKGEGNIVSRLKKLGYGTKTINKFSKGAFILLAVFRKGEIQNDIQT